MTQIDTDFSGDGFRNSPHIINDGDTKVNKFLLIGLVSLVMIIISQFAVRVVTQKIKQDMQLAQALPDITPLDIQITPVPQTEEEKQVQIVDAIGATKLKNYYSDLEKEINGL